MGIFIVESTVCCLNLFEKCSSHQIQQTFQKVFTMEMPLQYHFTLRTVSVCMAVCSLQALVLLWTLHLQGGREHFIPCSSSFPSLRAFFLVFFLLSVRYCSSVGHPLVQWWMEHVVVFQVVLVSWEVRTIFHVLSERKVLPCTLHSCFMTVFL